MIENEQSNMTELSPKIWAHHILNKVFIIHGANDSMVPYTESIQLAKILPNCCLSTASFVIGFF